MLVLSVLAARAAWTASYIPTNDGPQHILSTHIENHYSDPDKPFYAATLLPAPQFAYKGFSVLYGPLEKAFGWRDGLRIATAIMVLASAWAFAACVLAFEPKRRFVAYFGFVLAWMWPLYMGFFAHVVGTAVGFAVLAFAIRAKELDARRVAIITAGFAVQSVAHAWTATLSWPLLVVLLLARAEPAKRLRVIGMACVFALPLAIIGVGVAYYQLGLSAPRHAIALGERLATFPRILAPGPSWRAWLVVACVLGAAVAAGWRVKRFAPVERAAFALGVALLVLGVLLPRDVFNWQFFAPRLAPIGAALVLFVTPLELVRPVAAGAASFALAAASMFVSADFNRSLADGCADALGGLDAPIQRRFISLPIVLDAYCAMPADPKQSSVPYNAPLSKVGALYAAAQGGTTPYLFIGSPAVHAFMNRKDSSLPVPILDEEVVQAATAQRVFHDDPKYRRAILRDALWFGMSYEGILIAGAEPRDVDLVKDVGFELDYARGSFLAGHFHACSFEVVVPAETSAVAVAASPPDGSGPVADLPLAPLGDGRFRVEPAPCGDIALHVRALPSGRRCATADGHTRVRATIARSGSVVRCEQWAP